MNLKPTKEMNPAPQYPMMEEGWNKVTPTAGYQQSEPFVLVEGKFGEQVLTAWKDEDGITVTDYIPTNAEWRFTQIENALEIERPNAISLEKWCSYMQQFEENTDEPCVLMIKVETSVNAAGKPRQKVVGYAMEGKEEEVDAIMAATATAKKKGAVADDDDADFNFGENKKKSDGGMSKKSGTASKGSGKKGIEF